MNERKGEITKIILEGFGMLPVGEAYTLKEMAKLAPECDHMARSAGTNQILKDAQLAECMTAREPDSGNKFIYTREFLPGERCKTDNCYFTRNGNTRCPLYFANKEE